MGGPSKFNDRLPQLIELVKSNTTDAAIGAHFGISYQRVQYLRKKMKKVVPAKKWKPDKNKRQYTYPQAAKKLGIPRSTLVAIIKKNGIAPSLRRGSESTYMLSGEQLELIAKDPGATRITKCSFCGAEVFNKLGAKLRVTCREKACRARYFQERHKKAYKRPFNPKRLMHQPKKIWEKLSINLAPEQIDWISFTEFEQKSGLSRMQISHLARLRVIKIKPDETRVHPVTKRPIRWYALHEAILIAEVVNSEGP